MKATELRIGNYVIEKGKIKPMYSISNHNAKDYSRIEPIPLTEECLLKFGFEKIGTYFKINNEFEILTDNGRYYYYINLDRLYLNSIHQLQNLFYCLCGEELTFKSE